MTTRKFMPGDRVELDPNLSILDSSRFAGKIGTVVGHGNSDARGQWIYVDVDGEKKVPFLDIELRRVAHSQGPE